MLKGPKEEKLRTWGGEGKWSTMPRTDSKPAASGSRSQLCHFIRGVTLPVRALTVHTFISSPVQREVICLPSGLAHDLPCHL